MKKQMALYRENLEEQIGTGAICQEVAIVKENSDGVTVELYSIYRNADGKIIEKGAKVIRQSDTFESGIQICKWAGFKPMKVEDILVNFNDEKAIVYELENGMAIYMFNDEDDDYHISKKFENADKATEFVYRKGFRF